ncbi:MAG TPA: hypothetical protein VLF94_00910 [Chlamydiales bacterium]|nr:hypothetical protein [Chlamydiales bacterium]
MASGVRPADRRAKLIEPWEKSNEQLRKAHIDLSSGRKMVVTDELSRPYDKVIDVIFEGRSALATRSEFVALLTDYYLASAQEIKRLNKEAKLLSNEGQEPSLSERFSRIFSCCLCPCTTGCKEQFILSELELPAGKLESELTMNLIDDYDIGGITGVE